MTSTEWLEIGKIVGAQGLNGELRIYPNTDFPERFLQPGTRWLLRPGAAAPEPIDLLTGRYLANKGLYVVQLAGIRDRNQAEQLRDSVVMVPESDRLPLDEDEFHVLDLLGLEVFDQTTQERVGTVVDVISAGNDLLQVQRHADIGSPGAEFATDDSAPGDAASSSRRQFAPATSATVLIPFVKAIVPVVDLAQKRIEITPPPGLIDG